MSRVFNFSAGPAALPETVLRRAAEEMLDWHGSGMSVMEMSHRGPEFISIAAEAERLLRELLAVPAHYKVLFMQGGAIGENAIVPMNLLRGRTGADYIDTGEWSKKSIKEAKKYCKANVVASSEATNFDRIPHGVVWPLYGREEEGARPGPIEDLLAELAQCGVTEVKKPTGTFEPEHREDCGAPLFANPEAEMVHAELPEEADSPAAHFH